MPRHTPQKSAHAAEPTVGIAHDDQLATGTTKWVQEVFNTEDAAAYLKVSRQLLEYLRVAGGGPRYVKLTRLVRYRKAALDEWLLDHERVHTAEGATR